MIGNQLSGHLKTITMFGTSIFWGLAHENLITAEWIIVIIKKLSKTGLENSNRKQVSSFESTDKPILLF